MTANEKRDRIAQMRQQANQLMSTWGAIIENPMDLNRLMTHIGEVTLSVDGLLNNLADVMEENLNEW